MTNCGSAELFVNGKSCGMKEVIRNRAEWEVPFEEGEISVIVEKQGQILTETVRTAGPVSSMEITDGSDGRDYDCSILNVCLMDENGIAAAGDDIDREVTVTVLQGTLVGAGNGDPNGIQPDVTAAIRTFNGRCQFLVRPENAHVQVKFSSKGLPDAEYGR